MRVATTLLAIAAALAFGGCSASPTEIDGGDQIFEGTVPFEGSMAHFFTITRAGGVRIQVESIVADPPLDEGFTPSLAFGLGEPNSDGDCALSFQTSVTPTSDLSFGLLELPYCIVLADNGTFAEDSSRSYTILLRPSE